MRMRDAGFYAGLAKVIRRGEMVDLDKLVEHLRMVGYSQVDVVEMPGEFAHRGGLLDVYPPESDRPVRIEFFGDEVESIRKFDPGTQRSAASHRRSRAASADRNSGGRRDAGGHQRALSGERLSGSEELIEQTVRASGVAVFPGWELYAPVAGAERDFFDLLPNAPVVLDEPDALDEVHDAWWTKVTEAHERSLVGNLVRPEELYLTPEQWSERCNSMPTIALEQLGIEVERWRRAPDTADAADHALSRLDRRHDRRSRAGSRAKASASSSPFPAPAKSSAWPMSSTSTTCRSALAAARPSRAAKSTWTSRPTSRKRLRPPPSSKPTCPKAWCCPSPTSFCSARAISSTKPEVSLGRPQRQKSKVSAFLSDFRDLAIGDYVVHVEHGIGQYQGLKEIPQEDGGTAEFMVLEYAEGARLYVPLTRLDLVQKYRSSEGVKPVLNRLGTQQWQKTKARVKKAMKDMAEELLKLYAVRKTAEGHAFAADTEWQREFEDTFEFNETEDQMNAIVDVKRDMESPTPMDRLLCGDVGYGKTEVAMRAAFKAVSDNRQVAVLAPTTVLAFQHYNTFRQRFAAFPIKIEMLSRFRTPKQQKETIAKIEAGQVDIVIGTHRVLSKDVKFTDLGLVIVDEEQRFGVRHKERLKQLRKEVDVLTMSATPIPRTLHMSLLGLRDMSVIETPPKDRMAIQTVVAAWDEKLMRSAIEKELERGGQVYFVHNRVESIYDIADKTARDGAQGAHPGRPRADAGERTGTHHARLHAPRSRHPGGDHHHRERARYSAVQYHHHQPRRSPRAVRAVPVARTRGPLRPPRLCVSADSARPRSERPGAAPAGGAERVQRSGRGLQDRGARSGAARRGKSAGRRAERPHRGRGIRALHHHAGAHRARAEGRGARRRCPRRSSISGSTSAFPPTTFAKRTSGCECTSASPESSRRRNWKTSRASLGDRYGTPPPPVRNLLEYAALKLLSQRIGVAQIERRREAVSIRFTEKATVDPERLARFVAGEPGSAVHARRRAEVFAEREAAGSRCCVRLKSLLEQLAGEQQAVA